MKTIAALLIMVLLIAPQIFAQPLPKHSSELAVSTAYLYYKEPAVMKERGMMYGVSGTYAYHDTIMLKAQGRSCFGEVDYKGSGTVNNIEDFLFELRGLGGIDLDLSEGLTVTPYSGFGWRYLNDDISGKVSTTGAVGYERESNYYYFPVGIEVAMGLENDWSFGATAEYDIFWKGQQLSHLSDIPGDEDSKNRQSKGYGLRGSVKLQKNDKKLNFFIEPYAIYWSIKSSKVSDQGVEPKNFSIEGGIKVGMGF